MSNLEAIILAGGFGTRLRSVVADVPKPMADINGRPFLDLLIEYLSGQGIKKIILSLGFKHEIIRDFFAKRNIDVDIKYVIEDEPLGTGGAIKKALKSVDGEDVLICNGDSFFQINLRKMLSFHRESNVFLTIAVKPMNDFDRYGAVVLKDNRIINFEEKAFKKSGHINAGVYIMKRTISELFSKDAFSFENDFLKQRISDIKPAAFIEDGYFIDIGIPEDYVKANKELDSIFWR